MTLNLDYIPEPLLRFGHEQALDDPRTGLFLFGPLSEARKPKMMRVGVVGTPEAISIYREWVRSINRHIPAARQTRSIKHHIQVSKPLSELRGRRNRSYQSRSRQMTSQNLSGLPIGTSRSMKPCHFSLSQ